MLGIKPNPVLWAKVNKVIMGESMGTVLITFISAMTNMIWQAGFAKDAMDARVKLAAMLLSPDTSPIPGSLEPGLQAAYKEMDDGKWVT